MLVWALLFVIAGASPFGSAAVANESEAARLQQRLEGVQARADAKYAKGALEQARQALAMSEQRQGEAALSAQHIAEAALVLAERQLARREAQEAFFAAYRRVQDLEGRAKAQRRALEALLKERARIARARGPVP